MLAEEPIRYHVHSFCRLSGYIASLLALLVITEGGGYMTRQVMKLMHKGIKELSWRGYTAYNQHTLAMARITQPRIESSR